MILAFYIGFLEIKPVDIVDIGLVGILLYQLYKLIRGSVAVRIFVGLLLLYTLYLVVRATEMTLLTAILGQFMGVGVIAAVILFQQEIKKFLLLLGKTTDFQESKLFNLFRLNPPITADMSELAHVLDAIKAMSATKTGALIVISRQDNLKTFIETGDLLDAKISKRLIESIFYKNSPLHDGACIIYKNRIVAAKCILPISESTTLRADVGLRHRAAIGITEHTDTFVLVVSEQTGQMSCVRNGQIEYHLSIYELRKRLHDYIVGIENQSKDNLQENENYDKTVSF
jgi:uncharacterized protein (TIGR00159 family)